MWRAGRACPDSNRNTDLGANVDPGVNVDSGASAVRQVNVGFERSSRPFVYPKITNTNGYNTYVANNMWAAGGSGMTQTLTAADPGTWYVVAKAPAGTRLCI